MLAENDRKKALLNCPRDPVTGLGCTGERIAFAVTDAPLPVMYLPAAMMQEKVVTELLRRGSIAALYRHNGAKLTDEDFTEFWIAFCELRYRYDFEYFAVCCLTIRDKLESKDIPFALNRGQCKLLAVLEKMRIEGRPVRAIILKARQWGCSTLVQLYMLWIQIMHRKNWNSVITAHTRDASVTIRAMYEHAIRLMIPVRGIAHTMRGFQGTQNIRTVPERGCRITVGTAIEPESVRSQDVKMAHFSEMALYPDTTLNSTAALETSIIASIPAAPCTLIIRESTANGIGGYFYEEWEKAKRGETAFEPVFVPWFLFDIYSLDFGDGYWFDDAGKRHDGGAESFAATLSDYEINLFRNHAECTLEHLNWRRLKGAEISSEAKMRQDYPADDIEAFQDSGRPVFRSDDVERLREGCRPPLAVGCLVADGAPASAATNPARRRAILSNLKFEADPEALRALASSDFAVRERAGMNRLQVWAFPDTVTRVANRYLTVFDPQRGLSDTADYGVIAVFDRYWRIFGDKTWIAAQWRGRVDKDITIWIAAQIAAWYGNALLVVESNTYDSEYREDGTEFIFNTLSRHYDNLYGRVAADRIRAGAPQNYGFNTNRSTKPMIVNNFTGLLREGGYVERCHEALNEARTYEQKKNGSYGAKERKHDDILMTRMIGLHVDYCEMDMPRIVPEEGSAFRQVRPTLNEAMI
jgi:hypothetical protein